VQAEVGPRIRLELEHVALTLSIGLVLLVVLTVGLGLGIYYSSFGEFSTVVFIFTVFGYPVVVAITLVVLLSRVTAVELDTDGVSVERPLRRRRCFGWKEIKELRLIGADSFQLLVRRGRGNVWVRRRAFRGEFDQAVALLLTAARASELPVRALSRVGIDAGEEAVHEWRRRVGVATPPPRATVVKKRR
jgi:hypothetical protein